MNRVLVLTSDPLDDAALGGQRRLSVGQGAVVCFSGVVRGLEEGVPIAALDYEVFGPMAGHQFGLLFDELERRWPATASVRLYHRVGRVPVGETSLWVEVVAPHRDGAFAAVQWLIDEMKRVVPIWKRPVVVGPAGDSSVRLPEVPVDSRG